MEEGKGRPLQTVCHKNKNETGEIVMKDRKGSGNHLPESLPDVATDHPWQKLYLGIRN